MQDEVKELKETEDESLSFKINGSFNWGLRKKDGEILEPIDVLQDIDVSFNRGETVIVTGEVGAGKSSLLQAMLGNLQGNPNSTVEGENSISYCSQEPWLINASLRENIVMGDTFIEDKYLEVLKLCQLADDLSILPDGDQTELGQRGINLSGGQKARVNLARAVYKDSEVYLLDDIISALDAHVAKKIMDKLVFGYLASKTVILVTHASQFIPQADKVVVLSEGKVTFQGVPDASDPSIELVSRVSSGPMPVLEETTKTKKLVKEEISQKGSIPLSTYLKFVKYFGGWFPFTIGILRYFIISRYFRHSFKEICRNRT